MRAMLISGGAAALLGMPTAKTAATRTHSNGHLRIISRLLAPGAGNNAGCRRPQRAQPEVEAAAGIPGVPAIVAVALRFVRWRLSRAGRAHPLRRGAHQRGLCGRGLAARR